MSNELIIERYGNLLKQETLVLMDGKILPNTFVLEAPEPFPGYFGYYNDVPLDAKPLYVYFVLKQLYTLEEVTRAYQHIQKTFPAPKMHAAAGTVILNNDTYHVLRIRHLDSYDQVAELQQAFANMGFEFMKKPTRNYHDTAIIRIKKFFILKEIANGMYLDVIEPDHGYFVVPRMLPWEEFETITQQVKYNWELSSFDAAIGHFHHHFDIVDMVRIYNPQINESYLSAVRDKYFARIK
jgi:hypothetical protein